MLVVKLSSCQSLLAGSVNTVNNSYSSGDQLSREFNVFDDDEE